MTIAKNYKKLSKKVRSLVSSQCGGGSQSPPDKHTRHPMKNRQTPLRKMYNYLWSCTLIGLLAVVLCGCHSCPDLSSIKVDSKGYIAWEDAKRIILGCPVDTVAQNHALVVSITLKDGKQFLTMEPQIDDAWLLIKSNGLRKKIHYATE
jgi:hypothetical protein